MSGGGKQQVHGPVLLLSEQGQHQLLARRIAFQIGVVPVVGEARGGKVQQLRQQRVCALRLENAHGRIIEHVVHAELAELVFVLLEQTARLIPRQHIVDRVHDLGVGVERALGHGALVLPVEVEHVRQDHNGLCSREHLACHAQILAPAAGAKADARVREQGAPPGRDAG